VDTIWLAPELECRPLRFTSTDFDANGKVLRAFERSAMSVKLGEPDERWFAAPADYREVPPSQANRELHNLKTGRPFGEGAYDHKLIPGIKKMDEKYFESQQHRATGR
jgi:hypothetical protein